MSLIVHSFVIPTRGIAERVIVPDPPVRSAFSSSVILASVSRAALRAASSSSIAKQEIAADAAATNVANLRLAVFMPQLYQMPPKPSSAADAPRMLTRCRLTGYVCLPSNMRSRSGQPCSLCRAGDLCVLATARHIHICLRVAVLHNSPPPASVRPAAAPTVTALGTLGNWANGACVRLSLRGKARLLPRAASTVRSAILRRRNTAFSSRLRPVAHHANCRRAVPLRSSAMARFPS